MSDLSNTRGFNMFKTIQSDKIGESFVFSPYSLMSCVAMLFQTASGFTEQDLRSFFGVDAATLLQLFLSHQDILLQQKNVGIGNMIMIEDKMKPFTLASSSNLMGGLSQPIEFFNSVNGKNVAKSINSWVSKGTNKVIETLLTPEMITSDTAMILINYIYMKCKWAIPFPKRSTNERGLFRSPHGNRIEALMCLRGEDFAFNETETDKLVELPFKSEVVNPGVAKQKSPKYVMGFLLPNNGKLTSYSHDDLEDRIQGLYSTEIRKLVIPRFSVDATHDLENILINSGLKGIFSNVELGKLFGANAPKLFVSKVLQRAKIIVNEEGAEAAAVTTMFVTNECCGKSVPRPVDFIADHPFFFYIRELRTSQILFTGQFA
jgi:serine protease inhibitor